MPIFAPIYADANSVLERMRTTLLKPLSVEFTITRAGEAVKGSGSLVLQRPNRMRFTVTLGNDDFDCGVTEDGVIEMSRAQKVYMETGPLDKLYQPYVHFSNLPEDTFPLIILATDPRGMMSDAGNAQLVGTEKIGSVLCDHLKTNTYDAFVAPDGRLLRFRRKNTTFDFTNYKIGGTFPRSIFEPPVPAGFRPFVLTRETVTYQAGSPFPTANWVTMSGIPAVFESGKPFLAMVTSAGCEISVRAKNALATLKKDLAIWVLTDSKAPSGLEGFSTARDRSGRTLERMFVPVTPFFFLVDKDGRVKKLWMGFESKSDEKFIREVRAELGK